MRKKGTCIIAEVGQAHDGSLGILHSYIDAAADIGVDAVKFQVHIASAESSEHEQFRVPFSYTDKTRYDYWQRMELSEVDWGGVRKHCDERGVEFLASAFSMEAFDLLERMQVERHKVASGEVENSLLLHEISKTGKPVLLSTGLSTDDAIEETLKELGDARDRTTLLKCTTMYPCPPGEVGLNGLPAMRERFGLPVGLSDHSGSIFPGLGAATLGASDLECHIVFDKRMFGPDAKASLTVAEFSQLVQGVRYLEEALPVPVRVEDDSVRELKAMFGKTLALRTSKAKGEIILLHDLETKKPAGMGASAKEYARFVGRKLVCDKLCGDFLTIEDIDET